MCAPFRVCGRGDCDEWRIARVFRSDCEWRCVLLLCVAAVSLHGVVGNCVDPSAERSVRGSAGTVSGCGAHCSPGLNRPRRVVLVTSAHSTPLLGAARARAKIHAERGEGGGRKTFNDDGLVTENMCVVN